MDFLQPASWDEALAARAENPAALPLAGGTDVMVAMNFDNPRPAALLDLTRVPELAAWDADGGRIRLGAGVTYTRIIGELGARLPGLALAARTVGSPQIRNRGTIGGNLGTASPAGDCHPSLLAAGAQVEVASARGSRMIPAEEVLHRREAQRARAGSASLAARAADPVDDVRGTAAYRRHALAVLARRTLHWAWQSYRQGG